MTRPAAIQINKRNQVSGERNAIMPRHNTAPITGTTGTHGQRNLRGRSGLVRRNTITPMHTSTNASKVPTLHISPNKLPGSKATAVPTTTANNALLFHGVWRVG